MQANTYDSPAALGGNREDLRNVLTILEPEDTPMTSMIRKTPGGTSTFSEIMCDTLRKPRKTGTKEGQDAGKGGNKAIKRARFGTYAHRVMDEFGVSDVQEIISKRGGVAGVSDEYGNAKAKCVREVKRDLEAILCGDQEHHGGDESEMVTRGAFNWLKITAQTSNPVPADFLTLAASVLSGVGTSVPLFTEAQFNGIGKSLKTVFGGKKEFSLLAGNNVVDTIDNFTRTNTDTSHTRYQVQEQADEHEITLMVQIFESSFWRVNVVGTEFNKVSDTTGLGDANAALVIKPELWEMETFDPLHSADLPEKGGGPQGYVKAMVKLFCLNPKGGGCIYNT